MQSSLCNMLIQARKNLMEWKTWPHYDKNIRIHCLCSLGDKQMQCIVDIVLYIYNNMKLKHSGFRETTATCHVTKLISMLRWKRFSYTVYSGRGAEHSSEVETPPAPN